MQLKRIHLLPGALLALGLANPVFAADEAKPAAKAEPSTAAKPAAKADAASEAEIEAQLEAARERLEAAAREVAELSTQLNGPMMEHFEFARRGSGSRASLGVVINGSNEGKPGVYLESVSPNGPASKAGLKAGDVLVSIDGKDLRDTSRDSAGERLLVQTMRSKKPGDKVAVEYEREGKKQKTEITTAAMDVIRFSRPRAPIPPIPPIPPVPPVPPMDLYAYRDHSMYEMELITLTPKLGSYFGTDKGVLVVRAPRKSDLKLEEGDVIVDISGRVPQSGGHALRILRSYQPGETVTVNVLRNRKSVKVEYAVPKRESESGAMWSNFPEFNFPEIEIEIEPELEKSSRPALKPAPQSAPSPPPAPAAGLKT